MKKSLYILLFTFISCNSIIAQCFRHISSGFGHNVAQKTDGSIWTWGWDGWLQMPNTSGWDENEPIPLSSLHNWLIVKAGQHNTFAISSNGSLWGIGGNNTGELGVGNTITDSDFKQIGTANNWKGVAPGGEQTVGIKTDNTLWAWGANYAYQVGDGTTTQRNAPVQIGTTADWKTAACSWVGVSFAIKNNGTLWAWGLNVSNLLYDNSVSAWIVPTQFSPDTNWDKISMGDHFILALKTDNTLWAWGGATSGEIGQDPAVIGPTNSTPYQIAGNWKAIAAGYSFSMGIKTDGTLWAWGRNDVGQLGDGTTTNRYIPIQLGTATNWDSVSCGFEHTVALRTDGSLWSWGTNDYGQLGNGTTTAVSTPTLVPVAGCTLANEQFAVSNELLVLPNPAKSEVAITYKGLDANATIELYDITGRSITSYAVTSNEGVWTMQTNTYPAGIYIVVVRSNNTIITQRKLIIK